MAQFLQSGRRRDLCAILAGESLQAQALKSRLEATYDTRIDPKSFYGALDALAEAGAASLETHLDWLLSEVRRAEP